MRPFNIRIRHDWAYITPSYHIANFTILKYKQSTQPMTNNSLTSPRAQNSIKKQASRERNNSVSSFESVINELSPEQSKFCSTFIENWELFESHIHSFEVMHTHHLFGSKFVIYKLKVVTDHVCYYIEKRYRDFLQLYSRISQFYRPKVVFPGKAHLRSKVCPFLTQNRRRVFDGKKTTIFVELISEIISMRNYNKSVVSQLIVFLDIKTHYNQLGLDEKIFYAHKITDQIKQKNHLFGHFLRHELLKIHLLPNKSIHYLQRIENLLSYVTRSIVRLDDLRTLMIGGNKVPGLIEIALSSSNEVVGLTFIRAAKKLIDLEVCPYAETFRRIIETAPSHLFYLAHEEMLENEELLISYFELVDLYLKLRLNNEGTSRTDGLLKEIFSTETVKKYVQWKMGRRCREDQIRRRTRIEMNACKAIEQVRSSMILSKVSQNSSMDEDNQPEDDQKLFWKQIDSLKQNQKNQQTKYQEFCRQDASFFSVSQKKKFLYSYVICKKPFDEIKQAILKWDHNKLVTSYYPAQVLTGINRIFFTFEGKSQKLFQFQQKIAYPQKNCMEMLMIPPPGLNTKNSFFYWLKVSPYDDTFSIQILYYFNNKKIRQLFGQEYRGKRNIMWASICSTFLDKKQTSSFGSIKTEQTLPGI